MSQQQQRNWQPSKEDMKKIEAGVDIVQTRRRVDELRVTILNQANRDLEASVLIISGWMKGDEPEKKK